MPEQVSEIMDSAEGLLTKKAKADGTGPVNFTETIFFGWIRDAYWKISRLLKVPRVTATDTTVANQGEYDIPADCLGGANGIISVTYDGKPVQKYSADSLRKDYAEDWKNPEDLEVCTYWVPGSTSSKIRLVPAPTTAGKTIEIEHIDKTDKPTARSNTIPFVFEEFIPDIPLYVAGRALERDREGRGAALLGEFESRILRTSRLQKREPGGRQMHEGRAAKLRAYHDRYFNVRR